MASGRDREGAVAVAKLDRIASEAATTKGLENSGSVEVGLPLPNRGHAAVPARPLVTYLYPFATASKMSPQCSAQGPHVSAPRRAR